MRHFKIPALLTCLIATQVVFAQSFSDVEDTHYYYEAVEWMKEEGMVNGYDDGSFQANNELNRVEALKMILSYANHFYPLETTSEGEETFSPFPDVEQVDWFYEFVMEGMDRGLVNGHEDGAFKPQDPVNRAQAMKMLISVSTEIELYTEGSWFEPYMDFAEHNALLIPDSNGDQLPSANMTRGELAEAIFRLHQERSRFTGEVEYGIASYYGSQFDGRTTASGAPLDINSMVAAHKTLPFGTWVRVTNTSNNRFVDLEIVDRGPYTPGRVIDLTPIAFEEIAWLSSGVANVRVEVLSDPTEQE